MEDDDREFLAAARYNDALVANLLIRLSRSETYAPRHQLPESSKPPLPPPPKETETAPVAPLLAPPLPPPPRSWGRRRARSAPVSAEGAPAAKSGGEEEEEAGWASPATPLSWSGASGTSGSGSEDGWSATNRRRRPDAQELGELGKPPQAASKRRAVVGHGVEEEIRAPPAKGTPPELWEKAGQAKLPAAKWAKVGRPDEDREPHGASVLGATAAVGSPAGCGSNKARAVAAAATRVLEPPGSVAHAEPLKSIWTGGRKTSAFFGRQGKKKTVPELRAMEEALLREQDDLHRELGKQREIYDALLEENWALKKLESRLPSLVVSKPTANSDEPQKTQSAEWQPLKGIVSTAAVVHDEDSPKQQQCTSSSSQTPERTLLFDLNCLPDDHL